MTKTLNLNLNLNEREAKLVKLVVYVLIGAAAYFFMVMPLISTVPLAREELTEKTERFQNMEFDLNINIKTAEQNRPKYLEEVNNLYGNYMLPEMKSSEITNKFLARTVASGLSVDSIKIGKYTVVEDTKDLVSVCPVNLTLKGSYAALKNFIRDLNKETKCFVLTNIAYQSIGSTGSMSVTATVNVYAMQPMDNVKAGIQQQ